MADKAVEGDERSTDEEQEDIRHGVGIDRMGGDILGMEKREIEIFDHLPARSEAHGEEDDNQCDEAAVKTDVLTPQMHRHMDLPQENIRQEDARLHEHQIVPPSDTSVEVESVAQDERAEAVEDHEDGDERRYVEAPCVTQHAGDTDDKRHAGILHRTHEDEAAGSVVEEGEFHQVAHA